MRVAECPTPWCAGDQPAIDQPTPDAVRAQLERLRTRAFAGSSKLFSFLRFVVEETLAGRGGTLKEVVIGLELYGSAVAYDPRIDSTVRVEARRLRQKLKTYYAGPGCDDPVLLAMPIGSYTPCFHLKGARAPAAPARADPGRADPGGAPVLAILPFTALSSEERDFAAGVTDELIYAAEAAAPFRAVPRAIMFQFRETRYSLDDVASSTGADFVLHGTVRRAPGARRVSVELSNRWGQILWSDRIDTVNDEDLDAQEQIAAKILARFPGAIVECA